MALRKTGARVWETSTTTGSGALTLAGAVTGFRAISAVCSDTNTIKLTIVNQATPTEWEQGIYTYNSGAGTLTRTTVLAGSNGTSAVSFGAGTKDVFSDPQPIDPDLIQNIQSGSSYTLDGTDKGKLVILTGNSATTVSITAAATLGDGWYCYLENAGTGTTGAAKKDTIDPNGSETIDGATTIVTYPGDLRLIQCDGSNFVTKLLRGGFIDVKVADSPFTFTVPTGWTSMRVDAWGAGGSGGAGEGRAAGIIRSGGGGGGGGKRNTRFFNAGDVGASVTVTVGAGAGTSSSATPGNGNNGGAGGNTTFGTLITAYGGGGGAGGGQTASTGGAGGGGASFNGVGVNATTSTGVRGGMFFNALGTLAATDSATDVGGGSASGGGSSSAGCSVLGAGAGGGGGTSSIGTIGGSSGKSAGGGGGGSGVNAASPGTAQAGLAGGNTGEGTVIAGGGGGAGGTAGGSGQTATQADSQLGGQGGGGGASSASTTGGAGGTGTVPGGGGGGGGGGTNTGGAGGNGGAGACRIWYQP